MCRALLGLRSALVTREGSVLKLSWVAGQLKSPVFNGTSSFQTNLMEDLTVWIFVRYTTVSW